MERNRSDAVTVKVMPDGNGRKDRSAWRCAKREGLPARTAGRRWPDIAAAGITVELIR